MRPVKAERAQRGGTRGKKPAARGVPRAGGGRTPPQAAFGKRKAGPTLFQRLSARLRGWFALKRPMMIMTLGLVVLALVVALFVSGKVGRAAATVNASANQVVADAGFGISELHLAGNNRTPPETIREALGFQLGESIFGADIHAARWRLKRLDWVADADVQRRYPDAIYVRLVEKLPFALWRAPDGEVWVVERAGGTITTKDIRQFASLPLLIGAGAPQTAADLVDAVAQHRAVAARVKAYERVSDRRWNLILDDSVVVQLPETGWQKELGTLEHLIVDKGVLERSISQIDLRSPTHYYFVLKTDSAKGAAGRGNDL
jgi:cell division protein FtsQ